MPLTTAVFAYAICCLAYFVFALVLPLRGSRSPITIAMMLAAAAGPYLYFKWKKWL